MQFALFLWFNPDLFFKALNEVSAIDIIICTIVALGVILGFIRGFVRQLASTFGVLIGIFVAKIMYVPLAEKLSPAWIDSMALAQVLSFILIWLLVSLALIWVASLLTKVLEAVDLGWANRLLGAVLGGVKYLLILSLLVCLFELVDGDNRLMSKTKKEESLLYYSAKSVAVTLFPVAKEMTQRYLLNNDTTVIDQ